MSRTIRRKAKWLVRQCVGRDLDDWCAPWAGNPDHPSWERLESERTGIPLETLYAQRLARHYGDGHRGRHSVPHSYRHYYGSVKFRSQERQRQHRALQYDEWDQHLTPKFPRDAGWYYW